MRKKATAVIKGYIWQYKAIAVLLGIWIAVFAGIFFLYRLELEAIVYAAGLCGFLSILLVIFHFLRYYKRYRALEALCQTKELPLASIPTACGQTEQAYQEALKRLQAMREEEATRYQQDRTDSLEYYTTWVHQAKAPIGAMRLMLQSDDTPLHQDLLWELFRIEQYTQMALNYCRLDDDASDFVFKEYPLDPIIRQSIRKFAPQFVRKRIRLAYNGTKQTVITDEKWLSFMLEQLLSNAVKYTDAGTIAITVTDNTLTVTDTGIGIAAEDLPRIFEKGFTGYNGRLDRKSTGLGLYLCQKTAHKLSCTLTALSTPGKGSQFQIIFPNSFTDPLE